MNEYESLSHARWECKYHLCRRMVTRRLNFVNSNFIIRHGSENAGNEAAGDGTPLPSDGRPLTKEVTAQPAAATTFASPSAPDGQSCQLLDPQS